MSKLCSTIWTTLWYRLGTPGTFKNIARHIFALKISNGIDKIRILVQITVWSIIFSSSLFLDNFPPNYDETTGTGFERKRIFGTTRFEQL